MHISPENYWREVWHIDCPKSRCGIMRPRGESVVIEDGSRLWLWECLHCGQSAFAGLNAQRFVTVRDREAAIEPA